MPVTRLSGELDVLEYALSFPDSPQTTVVHPVPSLAATSIFIHLYLNATAPDFFEFSLVAFFCGFLDSWYPI